MKKKARFISIFTFLFFKLSIINCIGQPSIHHFVKQFGNVAPYNNFGVQLAFQDTSYLLFTTDSNDSTRNIKTWHSDLYGNFNLINTYTDFNYPCNYNYKLIRNNNNTRYYLPGGRYNYAYYNDLNGYGIANIRIFNNYGLQINHKLIGDSSTYISELNGIQYCSSNYIFGCGIIWTPNKTYPFICKTDTLANVIFFKSDSLVLGGLNRFNDVVETTDSNLVVAGSWRWNSSFQGDKKIWLRKFSPIDGTIIWDKRQYLDSTAAGTEAAQGIKIVLANDSNLLVCGTADGLDNSHYSFAAKFNPANGNKIWTYKFLNIDTITVGSNTYYPPFTFYNYLQKIIALPNNGYVLFGTINLGEVSGGNLRTAIVKIDESGMEQWRKNYDFANPFLNTNRDDYIWDGVATNDGGFAMIGQTASNAFAVDVLFMKVTCNGDTAAPIAQFVPTVDINNNSLVTIHNTSMFYDTCIFKFSDGSADVIKTNTDATLFTHTFPSDAANYSITCIVKACSNEYDTTSFAQIITDVFNLNSKQGYLQPPVPNPSMYATNIKYYLPNTTKKAAISVTNNLGEIILQQNIEVEKYGSINLNIETLRSGIYLIHLITDIGVIGTRKLVVIK